MIIAVTLIPLPIAVNKTEQNYGPSGKKDTKKYYSNGWMDGWMDGWMGGWIDGC